jgi:dipicolinate synthase subunit A
MKMFKGTVLCIPRSEAVRHAAQILSELGICVTRKCAPDVTHVLLPVPSFSNGDEYLAHFLTELPDDVIISGGNLHSPLLEHYRRVDYLQDPYYLAENAAITADCALEIIEKEIPETCNVLVLGWGRIGKCLSQLLRCKGFEVTIAARKSADLAMIRALGYRSIPISEVRGELLHYRLIVNTVPELILPDVATAPDCTILELATRPGITGGKILNGRGLPGKMAPARSGQLIAETFIRLSI